jgi:penicillin-binding protein 1A
VLFLLGVVAFAFGLVTAVAGQIPQYDPAHQRSLAVNSVIHDSTGNRVLAVLRGRESRTIVPSSRISPLVKQAIVAIEDQRFYEHRGVDVRGIARAVWADIRSNRVVQGGSTITQQFVKNAIVTSEQSITRKLKEAALAWQLEQRWSKDRILTAYLNTIYFANGAWGSRRRPRRTSGSARST